MSTLIEEANASAAKGVSWSQHVHRHGLYNRSVAEVTVLAARFGLKYRPRKRKGSIEAEPALDKHSAEATPVVSLSKKV